MPSVNKVEDCICSPKPNIFIPHEMCRAIGSIFDRFVVKKTVELSGVDWDMVTSTMDEAVMNCFRCKNKGCNVCKSTKQISNQIKEQLR